MCFDDSLIADFDMFAQTLCACCEVYCKINDMNFIYCLAKLILQLKNRSRHGSAKKCPNKIVQDNRKQSTRTSNRRSPR